MDVVTPGHAVEHDLLQLASSDELSAHVADLHSEPDEHQGGEDHLSQTIDDV